MRRIISLILVFITALTFMACKAKDDDDIDIKGEPANDQSGSLIINEVLSSNKYWLELEEGFFPDFIELKNNSSSSVSLSQYSLTDNQAEPSKYVFPERTLEPGGLFVVYCGGSENTGNGRDDVASFKISSSGEDLYLYRNGVQETVFSVPELPEDISYGINDRNEYVYFALPSPGEVNTDIYSDQPSFNGRVVDADVMINEYMCKNLYGLIDEDGDRSSWVGIKNYGQEPLDLSGFGLSDNYDNAKKWQFPENTVLGAGKIILVYLSGKNKTGVNGELHASFRLGSDDDTLLISNKQGKAIDVVDVVITDYGNVSVGRDINDSEKWLYYASPTPGRENDTKGFSRIDVSEEIYLPDVNSEN